MRVIATAGHVDHGKSTLVRALTGTDPDRLAEEKARGLTIDLGFAGMKLPGGESVAFVDVPGHRRFIGNMLAGLGPAPIVMFVVAADQGWQAQSREHLDAVDALGITHGVLVLTRCALAEPERVREVRDEALAAIARTSLGVVEAVETDAVIGDGVDELRSALDELVESLPDVVESGPVRLWVDRSFSVNGAGTVVTGTLVSGTVRVGDTLECAGEEPVTVRSAQVLGEGRDAVVPVARVALGLRGASVADVPRGTPLTSPGSVAQARVVDVRGETGRAWSDASPAVTVHVGTAAVEAHVRPFDERHARLTLERQIPLRLGDRLIVRDASAGRIHAGVTVLDIDPMPLKRRGAGAARAAALSAREPGDLAPIVADRGVVLTGWVAAVGAAAREPVRDGLPVGDSTIGRVGDFVVHADQAGRWRESLVAAALADAVDELSAGLSVGAVTTRLGIPVDLVADLVRTCATTHPDAGLTLADGRITTREHGRSFGEADTALDALRERLHRNPFDAPEADDLTDLGLGSRELAAAAARGAVLRLRAQPADIVLLPDAPARAMRELARLEQPFTTSQARQALRTTRRVVIPLLEHLDGRGWTRREGNARSVVR